MSREVLKYFIDLDKQKLTRNDDNAIIENSPKIKRLGRDLHASSCRKVVKYKIAGRTFFAKSEPNKYFTLKTHEMASSKMYRDLGIATPPVYYMMMNGLFSKKPALLSQDLYEISKIDVVLCSKLKALKKAKVPANKIVTPYQVLLEKELRDYCLTFMTERCLDEILTMFMLGDLRSDADIHPDNYFLYKKQGEKRYSGVIPIDLEHSQIILSRADSYEDFKDFITKKSYDSCLPFRHRTDDRYGDGNLYVYNGTYADRINHIKKLIQSGKLTQKQLTILKRAINYDLPKTMLDVADTYNFDQSQRDTCDRVKRAWDYNRKELSREL